MAYTTVSNVADYLGITIDGTTTPSESSVSRLIDWATSEIDFVTKDTFESNTVVSEIFDYQSDSTETSATVFDNTSTLHTPYPIDVFRIPSANVISVSSVERNLNGPTETPDWETLTIGENGDVLIRENRIIFINPSKPAIHGNSRLRLSYTYGRNDVPSFVEGLTTKMASLEIMNGTQGSQLTKGTGKIRVGDIEIDDPGQFSVSFISSTQDDVNDKMDKLGTNQFILI